MMILLYLLLLCFFFLCFLLCFFIALQEGKTSGLGSSFGGSSHSLFGASTADVLRKITGYLSLFFFLFCFLLHVWVQKVEQKRNRSAPLSQITPQE